MSVEITQTDSACTLDAGLLRLQFTWRGDRWAHQLVVMGSVFASSFEWQGGDEADGSRVVSPAYQQLLVQEHLGIPQVLTVGQWGRHHFSGVFSVSDADRGGTLDVDVAVRTRDELQALASTYVVHRNASGLVAASTEEAVWELSASSGGRIAIEPRSAETGRGRVVLSESGRSETRLQAEAVIVSGSPNHRLNYRWRWEV